MSREVFRQLVERLRGRPVFVPLSMGLDSRLVVCMLRHIGYDRIETFSYGRAKNCEAAGARQVAHRLGVPWRFVPFTRELGRAFHEQSCREYIRFAHRGISIPSMIDVHAVRMLTECGVVVLSGSLPPGLPDDTYARLIHHARAQGVSSLVDTSGSALRLALTAGPKLVKINRAEVEELSVGICHFAAFGLAADSGPGTGGGMAQLL